MTGSNLPRIIAHRGASGRYPENTMAAFRAAWESGADGIECDLRVTSDGAVVAMHDASLRRTCRDRRMLSQVTRADLAAVNAAGGRGIDAERVPELRTILDSTPDGRECVLELKESTPLIAAMQAVLGPADFRRIRITLISFSHADICRAKQTFPQARALWLFSDFHTVRPRERVRFLCDRIADGGLDGCDLGYHRALTRELVEPIRAAGYAVYCYTINTPRAGRRCVAAGVNAITTDYPERFCGWTDRRDGPR